MVGKGVKELVHVDIYHFCSFTGSSTLYCFSHTQLYGSFTELIGNVANSGIHGDIMVFMAEGVYYRQGLNFM